MSANVLNAAVKFPTILLILFIKMRRVHLLKKTEKMHIYFQIFVVYLF